MIWVLLVLVSFKYNLVLDIINHHFPVNPFVEVIKKVK